MAKITPPIPQDKIGENFVWRDWFQRLSDKVFGTMGTQDSTNVSITGGTIDGTSIGATTPSTGVFTSVNTALLYVPTGTDGQLLIGKTSDHSFIPATLTAGSNITITNAANAITIASTSGSGTVTSVAATVPTFLSVAGSPITTSGTLAITLSGTALPIVNGGSGQTTAQLGMNAFAGAVTSGSYLRGNGTNVVMNTIQVADVPTLNQNTTGSAATLTTPRAIYGNNFDGSAALTQIVASTYGGTGNGFTKFSGATTTEKTYSLPDATTTILTTNAAVTILQGGTGQTTATAAFNALSPVTTTGDLIIGNGTNSSTRLGIGANNYVLTSNGTTASWAVATGSGATITNDTSTATNLYPLFSSATSGALTNVYTGNANYLFKPSTGELTALAHVSSNGIQINATTVATSYTIATGNNGLSAGPVSINTSVTVTISTGSVWTVV